MPKHPSTAQPHAPATLVVIGVSRGGLDALSTLLASLQAPLPLPVVIAQHRATDSDDTLAVMLASRTGHDFRSPVDKEPLGAGRVYLAPPDYHLLVERGCLSLSTEDVICHARPSVDALFETAADAYGPGVVAVILTGENADGAQGAARVKARGGRLLVQDPATAESPSMPEAARAAARPDLVASIAALAAQLREWCAGK